MHCTGSFSFSPPKNLLKIVHNQNLFIIIIWLLYGIPPYIHKKNGALSQTILQKIMIFFSTSENNVLEGGGDNHGVISDQMCHFRLHTAMLPVSVIQTNALIDNHMYMYNY